MILFMFCMAFPSSESIKCPAIILAVSRTDRVIGRMMFLIISMITMKGSNGAGVPDGTMWANIIFGDFAHPKIIIDSHRVNASGRFSMMCLVGVKI